MSQGKLPPYNQEAEMAVLGSILLNNDCWHEVYSSIESSDFYLETSRRIFDKMHYMFGAGISVDPVTLGHELNKAGELQKVGGAGVFSQLLDSVATSANAVYYANIVREMAAYREVIYRSQELNSTAHSMDSASDIALNVDAIVEAALKLNRSRMPTTIFSQGDEVMEDYKKVAAGYRGIPFPWKTIDNMTAGLWPGTVTMFVARPGLGKCVKWDTEVCCSDDGVYRTIKEVVGKKLSVFTKKTDGSIGSVIPSDFIDNGMHECIKLKFRSGREISVTKTHPLFTVSGWREAGSLSVGEFIEVAKKVPSPINEKPIPYHEVVILAALLSEGGYTGASIGFTNFDNELIDLFRRAVESVGCVLNQQLRNGVDKGQWGIAWDPKHYKNSSWIGMGQNPVRDILDYHGCGKKGAREKEIPDAIFSASNDKIALFLGVFWAGDGGIEGDNITITLASKKMVYQIQRLLLRLGIRSSVNYKRAKCNGKYFDSWRLYVWGSSRDIFAEKINVVVKHKQESLSHLRELKNSGGDMIPIDDSIKLKIRNAVGRFTDNYRIDKLKRIAAKWRMKSRLSANKFTRRNQISRKMLREVIDEFDIQSLEYLLCNNWDEITSIEDDGLQQVYDLSVDGTHNFLANDIVAHNSSIAVICGRHAWLAGKRVLIISPEMSKKEMAERFFSMHTSIGYHNIISGQMSSVQEEVMVKKIEEMKRLDGLWIADYDDDISPGGIDSAIRACDAEVVAVDSMYDIHVKGERQDRMLACLEWLKKSCKAKGHKYAAIGFSQQNRGAEVSEKKGGGSRLGTIAFADAIGQDAQIVFALEQSKDDKADKVMRIKPLKVRRGYIKKEEIKIWWDWDRMIFEEREDENDEEYNNAIPF